MPLTIGSRLGHYDVTALIGEGGMGQVYQATDTKLNRQVALKILPEAFASDPDRLARFEREAQVLASLNHPNIAAIHGLEDSEGTKALVLELVEGPTLADRIAHGPIPVDEALPIAKQIAEALEAAHEAGVIHRDLKPANIKVRADGTVKVLDFGLAKALDTTPAGDPSQSPTLTAAATQMGVIMGTAAYMSPEQARGKSVDKRSDIWAFGCVFYEMLTGQRVFEGEDITLTLAEVVKSVPDLEALPGQTPLFVRDVLARCLVKDPTRRVRDVGDVRLALDGAGSMAAGLGPEVVALQPPFRMWQRPLPVLGALAIAIGIGAVIGVGLRVPVDVAGVVRTTLPISVAPGIGPSLTISPDGTHVVHVGPGADGGAQQLYRRALDELESVPLSGSDRGSNPVFSSDGRSLAFVLSPPPRVFTVPVSGSGVPELIAPFSSAGSGGIGGVSWGPDDRIVLATSSIGLFEVAAGGGETTQLTTTSVERGELQHVTPSVMPSGRGVLFGIVTTTNRTEPLLAVLDREAGTVNRLGLAGVAPRYLASGHLIYVDATGTLWAVGFDEATLAVVGTPVPVVSDISVRARLIAEFSVSDQGRLVYVRGGTDVSLVEVDRDGQTVARIGDTAVLGAPRFSPDGQRLAFIDVNNDVWVWDLERRGASRLTAEGASYTPVWSSDGSTVMYGAARQGDSINLRTRAMDLSGPEEVLFEAPETLIPGSWSRDGGAVVYYQTTTPANRDIWVLDDGEPRPVAATGFDERAPRLSPDGRWVAFVSDQDGQDRVYLRPLSGGGILPVSTGRATEPVWAADGRELFFRDGDSMMVVDVEPAQEISVGSPRVLFTEAFASDPYNVGLPNYDVSPDGQRFVMVTTGQGLDGQGAEVVLVDNWFEELRRLVPLD